MSDKRKSIISEALRKRVFRAKMRDEMEEEAYKNNKEMILCEYRAKIKQKKTPQEQQKQIVQQVVQQVVQNVTPAIVKEETQETEGKITNFSKPISKEQYLKNIKNEPIKDFIKEINTTLQKENSKTQNILSDNEQQKQIVQ